jgi:FdhD protein
MVRRLQSLFERVDVVTNRPEYLRHWLDVPIHRDVFPGLGPIAGVHAALQRADSESVFILACDLPLVTGQVIRRVLRCAAGNDVPAVIARTGETPQPLCGVYRKELLAPLGERLREGRDLSIRDFLAEVGPECIEMPPPEAARLRDVDAPEDLSLLREAFDEVEPLPVRRRPVQRIGGKPLESDLLVEERPFSVHVNGVHLATLLCLPNAVREMAVGFLAYLGLEEIRQDATAVQVDYEEGRVAAELNVPDAALKKAVALQISSTCGAEVFGPPLPELEPAEEAPPFQARPDHILATMRALRGMAPVFACTGATHQAAFTDGEVVLHCEEDVGRHNAIDKVVGHCLLKGTDTSRGILLTTGRLNAQAVAKALRQRIPILASGSAATAHAVQLAERHGLTLVGFARGGRLNVYSGIERLPGR